MAKQDTSKKKEEKELKLDIDEAERKRRSELAKKLHAEGKFGGVQKGAGRPKKERAQERVAEAVREDAEEIVKALRAALKSGQPATRMKAALAMLEIEQREINFVLNQEQRQYDNMSRDKLLELIAKRIAHLNGQGIDFSDFIEGEAEELATKQLDA